MSDMVHDREYFERRAAQARAAAFCKDDSEAAGVAGDLALAFASLAKRRATPTGDNPQPAIPLRDQA